MVDDVQWLDRASANVLGFAARRLLAESVVLLLAERETSQEFDDLPELVVQGLGDGDARELLAAVVRGPFDETGRTPTLGTSCWAVTAPVVIPAVTGRNASPVVSAE